MDSTVTQPGGPAGPAALRPVFVRFPMYLRAICSGFPTQIAADREAHHLSPFAGTGEKTLIFFLTWSQYLILRPVAHGKSFTAVLEY